MTRGCARRAVYIFSPTVKQIQGAQVSSHRKNLSASLRPKKQKSELISPLLWSKFLFLLFFNVHHCDPVLHPLHGPELRLDTQQLQPTMTNSQASSSTAMMQDSVTPEMPYLTSPVLPQPVTQQLIHGEKIKIKSSTAPFIKWH